jgi:hypothetical protein
LVDLCDLHSAHRAVVGVQLDVCVLISREE